MKPLSIAVALFGLVALVQPALQMNLPAALLGIVALISAVTTFRSTGISSFLKIFVGIFSTETIVFGLAVLAARAGLWPSYFAQDLPPESLPLTVAIFSILVYAVAQLPTVEQIMRIADRYFNAGETARARIWPLPAYRALERRIAVAMVVFLVVINQAEVAIIVRLNFFNRAWFDAIQQRNEAVFWEQLLLVFTPYAFLYVAMTVVEFFVQSMLVIRWRTWLTDHFVSRWLARHNHYRISLVAGQTDNPDQRISEDIFRFINGGSDGSNAAYGLYDFSILLISTVTTLVSFSIVLWTLSESFTLPGTNIVLPGFLFWVALIYAAAGTLITHLIGRPLISLYFQRQHMEADFRFSLARLREYTEQVALLDGEDAEKNMLGGRFAALVANFLAVIFRRMRVTAFTQTFGQLSPIIPFIFTAPFYFARKIELGTMTQTAGAFAQVSNALTFFVNYYTYLAGFKSVVDRLNSFDAAIDQAQALTDAGPARVAAPAGAAVDRPRRCRSRPAGRQAHRRDQTSGTGGRRKRGAFRPLGLRQIDAVSRDFRHLAVRRGPHQQACGHPRHGGAAEALYSDRHAALRRHLSGGGRHLSRRGHPQRAGRCPSRRSRRRARPRGGVVAAPVERRAAAPGAGARLLMRPDWLLLDESTSAVEEKLEAELYAVLARRLPKTTIVSIGHRSTLVGLHHRHLEMTPEGDHFTLRDAVKAAAAE